MVHLHMINTNVPTKEHLPGSLVVAQDSPCSAKVRAAGVGIILDPPS